MIEFTRHHIEYGEKVLDLGSSKRAFPIYKDSYTLTCQLSEKYISLYKDGEKQKQIVCKTKLSKAQQKFFKSTFKNTDFASLVESSGVVDSNGVKVMIEDGFIVRVLVRQSGKDIAIIWNNAYVKPLVELFDLANELSPEQYRTYKPSEKHKFMEMLRQNSQLGRP